MIGEAARRLRAALGGQTPDDRFLDGVAAGGARFDKLVYTRNHRVMASVADGGRTLRVHEVFAEAPPEVLRALGASFAPGRDDGAKTRARRVVRQYLAVSELPDRSEPVRRRSTPARPRPGDDLILARLRAAFDAVNEHHFGGALPGIPLRISDRMRRRNGHFRADPPEIAISRALFTRAVDGEAEHTLRHEMIHLWQWKQGKKPDHGPEFRQWARILDVHPRARRHVRWRA